MSLSVLSLALGNECSYDPCWNLDKEQGPRYYMMGAWYQFDLWTFLVTSNVRFSSFGLGIFVTLMTVATAFAAGPY